MSFNSNTDNMFNDNNFSSSFLLTTAEIAKKLERQHQLSQSRVEAVIEGKTISIGLSDSEEYYSNGYQEYAASDDKTDSSVPKLSQDNSPTTEYRLSPVEASFIEEDDQESYVMVEKESVPEHVSEANQVPEKEGQEMKDASIEDDAEMEAAADEPVKSKPVTSDNAVVATQEVTIETVSQEDQEGAKEPTPQPEEKEKTPEPESMDVTPQPEEKIPKETEKAPEEKEKVPEEKEKTPEEKEKAPEEEEKAPEEKEKTPQPESMNITSQPEEKEKTPEEKSITPQLEETKEPSHLEKQVEEQAVKEKDTHSQAEQDKEKETTIEKHIDNEKKKDASVEKQAEEEKQEETIVEKETEQEKEEEPVVEQQAESSNQDGTPQKQDISKPTEEALMEIEETATEPKEPEEMNNDTSPLDQDKENRIPPKVTEEETPEPQDIVMTEQEEEEEKESEEVEPKEKSMSPVLEKEDTPIEDDDEENDQDQYEVETIRSHKIYRGKVVKYEIKWINWPEEDNTIELSETIHADVPDICTEYWSNLKLKSVPTNVKQFVNKRSATPESVQRKATPEPVNKRKATPEASAPTKRARTATYTVKKHEVMRKLITAGFVIPSTEEWPNTLDDWESDIASIHSVQPSDKDEAKLLAYLKWNNGKKTIHLLKDIHNKCPKKLIDYYEGRLRFYK